MNFNVKNSLINWYLSLDDFNVVLITIVIVIIMIIIINFIIIKPYQIILNVVIITTDLNYLDIIVNCSHYINNCNL